MTDVNEVDGEIAEDQADEDRRHYEELHACLLRGDYPQDRRKRRKESLGSGRRDSNLWVASDITAI